MSSDKSYHASRVLLPDGWAKNVLIKVDSQGVITQVLTQHQLKSCKQTEVRNTEQLCGTVIAGIPNIHSHAFQRAMAGLAEHKTSQNQSFWTWRDTMYDIAHKVSSGDVLNIASWLYVEMLKAGYTSVAEFHYLHHQSTGQPYSNIAQMSDAIINSAKVAGIGLTHLPVLYMNSGFGDKPLTQSQRRFGNSIESYIKLLEAINGQHPESTTLKRGMAIHSLRAVPPNALTEATTAFEGMSPKSPKHIHISEQQAEVEQCIDWSGKRPVEWLLDNAEVNEQWCLVHATHLSQSEVQSVAQSGAVVGICPTTEANLGDGVFSLQRYLGEGGSIAIGSDSNSSVSPIEELRWLEYVQRLQHQGRNLNTSSQQLHNGAYLYQACVEGGAQATGQNVGKIAAGYRADFLVLDDNAATMFCVENCSVIDSLIFSGNQNCVKDVMVAGLWQVQDYRHQHEEQLKQNYFETLNRLRT